MHHHNFFHCLRRLSLLLLATGAVAAHAAAPAKVAPAPGSTTQYVVLSQDKVAGKQVPR